MTWETETKEFQEIQEDWGKGGFLRSNDKSRERGMEHQEPGQHTRRRGEGMFDIRNHRNDMESPGGVLRGSMEETKDYVTGEGGEASERRRHK